MAKIKGSITVFPAHAGVILTGRKRDAIAKSLSRTCGGDPQHGFGDELDEKSFPHMRG